MNKFITNTKSLLQNLRKGRFSSYSALVELPDIVNPDFEILVSKKILNDFLRQNLPFQQSLPFGLDNQLLVSIADAEIQMIPGSQIGLRITDALIKYGQKRFRVGLHTNSIEASLSLTSRRAEKKIFISLSVDLSTLDIRFFPNWLAHLIVNYLKSKWLGPLIDVEMTQYLNLNTSQESEFGTVKFNKKLETIAIQTSEDHIRVKVKYKD